MNFKNFSWNGMNKFRGILSPNQYGNHLCATCYIAYAAQQNENEDLRLLRWNNKEEFENTLDRLTTVSGQVSFDIKQILQRDLLVFGKETLQLYNELYSMPAEELIALYEYTLIESNKFDQFRSYDTSSLELVKLCNYFIQQGKKTSTIIDVCSGKGIFLIEASKRFPLAKLSGVEINIDNAFISELYMKMIGKQACIMNSDFLSTRIKNKYDVVFTEFPMNMYYGKSINFDENSLFNYEFIKKNTNYGFIFKSLDILNDDGTMIAVVNNGCLLSAIDRKNTKQLIDQKLVKAVISMPSGTLYGTQVKYSILILSKSTNNSVMFMDASECYKNIVKSRVIDVERIIGELEVNKSKLIKWVPVEEIANKEYSLHVNNYMDQISVDIENPIPLGEVATVLSGFQYTTKTVEELPSGQGDFDVIRITDIDEIGEIDYNHLASINVDEKKIKKYILQENDIILSTKGTLIKLALVKDVCDKKLIVNGNLSLIRVDPSKIDPMYLYSFLNSEIGRYLLTSIQTGATIMSISRNALERMDISMPDRDEQEAIAVRFSMMRNELISCQNKMKSIQDKMNKMFGEVS